MQQSLVNLKGNARTSGERRQREAGNVFDDKIRVGVAVYFLVRREGLSGFKVFYHAIDDYLRSPSKVGYIKGASLEKLGFDEITPDGKGNWLNQSNNNFDQLLLLADRQTKSANSVTEERAVFKLNALGVNTARDEWVYEFDIPLLREKVLFFSDAYNGFLDAGDKSYPPIIKWSRDLRNEFNRGRRIIYNDELRVRSLYRPFVVKQYFANSTMNDVLTRNHFEMFGEDFTQQNRVVNLCSNGRYFYALASDKLTDWHFTGDTQCLPLYRYTGAGERVSNITGWGLRRVREYYGDEGITAEEIFAYTYAVPHDPVYRQKYAVDLLREFPRLPLYPDFRPWAEMGQRLLDLHIGFESVEPYPLKRQEREGVEPKRVILRADKDKGTITLDDRTTLSGVPPQAWEYRLGSRSALEWVLDQYKERKPRDPTIRERFNTYRFADQKERVTDLLGRVSRVSVATMEIVDSMADWEEGELVVHSDRDNPTVDQTRTLSAMPEAFPTPKTRLSTRPA